MRAPVSRSRPQFMRRAGLLVFDHALVRDLGLRGELALGVADRDVAVPDPAGSRAYLGAPAMISSRRSLRLVSEGLLVRVVLAAGEHAPEQNRQRARYPMRRPLRGRPCPPSRSPSLHHHRTE